MPRKVLLTGAGGRIGSAFRDIVGDRYDLRLADRDLTRIGDHGRHEAREANVADLEVCRELCEGIDTVVHLAADPSPRAGFYESLLDNNIKAVYNIFQAAKDAGCRRVVYASSIQVINGYPLDVQAKPDSPIKPLNMYAVGKAFGEATAHYFAYAQGLSSIAIRVGAYEGNRPDWEGSDGRSLSAFVSKRDLCHLIERCIEVEDVQFAIVQAVSDNRFKRMDITSTREVVGYAPLDDSFVLFGPEIHDTDLWNQEYDRGQRRKEASS